MSKFMYIAAFLNEPDPEQATLHNAIIEKITGRPRPDVVSPHHPSCIRFRHAVIEADSADDAYARGWDHVEHLSYKSMNDYVIALEAAK